MVKSSQQVNNKRGLLKKMTTGFSQSEKYSSDNSNDIYDQKVELEEVKEELSNKSGSDSSAGDIINKSIKSDEEEKKKQA